MKWALGFLLAAGGAGVLFQSTFRASGAGAVDRTAMAKLRDTVSVKDFGAPCDGTNDDAAAFTAAIAALPAGGGVVHAEMCSAAKFASSLTIGKGGVTIYMPSGNVALGANQIVVPVGVHNVALIGAAPYGSSAASQTAATGTFLTYTGTGVAVVVGDSTGDTYGFRLQDVTVGLTTAGTASTGLQLNRAIQCVLQRPRVHGFQSANTQIAIDLEGFVNFTGCRIEDYYLWNGNAGIFFGKNANANWLSGGIILNNNAGGTCLNFAGAVGGAATGNAVFGGDCEAVSGTAIKFDVAAKNQVFGFRNEIVTAYINATANSFENFVFGASTSGTVTDNGVASFDPNSFNTVISAQFNTTNWKLYNRTDTTTSLNLYAGSSVAQQIDFNFNRLDAGRGWDIRKTSTDNLLFLPNNGVIRFELDTGGGTFLNTESNLGVLINSQANSGTGGLGVYSGGASPTRQATIIATGDIVQTGRAFSALGVPSQNGNIIYCTDCTIANPCAGGGTGAIAKRLNGAWICN